LIKSKSKTKSKRIQLPPMKLAQGVTLIFNGQLIDGTGAPPVPDGAVVVENGRIAYAGRAAQTPLVPPDT
jgi:imidazolonepropionase-like amidohydrolase